MFEKPVVHERKQVGGFKMTRNRIDAQKRIDDLIDDARAAVNEGKMSQEEFDRCVRVLDEVRIPMLIKSQPIRRKSVYGYLVFQIAIIMLSLALIFYCALR